MASRISYRKSRQHRVLKALHFLATAGFTAAEVHKQGSFVTDFANLGIGYGYSVCTNRNGLAATKRLRA